MRIRPNPHLAAELKRKQGAQVRNALKEVAEEARERADNFAFQAHAPWMPMVKTRRQLVVTEVTTSPPSVRIVLRGYGAHLIEFGSQNNPPHAPLRRGVRAAGLGLSETDE